MSQPPGCATATAIRFRPRRRPVPCRSWASTVSSYRVPTLAGLSTLQDKANALGSSRGILYGDLGAFWPTEIVRMSPSGPILVGPVSMTTPELPVSMTIELQGASIAQVTAVTGSGHTYVFAASPNALGPAPSP